MKNILVFGATGGTGKQIIDQALSHDYKVTAFVRNPVKLGITHKNLSIAKGDVLNQHDVEKAVKKQDAVLSALGVKPGNKAICTPGIKNIILAMKEYNVSRLVVESAYGARDSRIGVYANISCFFLRTIMKDKDDMEAVIEKSNLDWVVVRPTILNNGPRTGSYRTGMNLKVKGFPKISRADVADFMVKLISEDDYLNQFPTITY